MPQTHLQADGGKHAGRRLGPLDEAHRSVEIGLEVTPLGGGDDLEAEEVEVLVTGAVTPRARAAPRTNVVLPAPSSPATVTTSPGWSRSAMRAAMRSVSAGEVDSTSIRPR